MLVVRTARAAGLLIIRRSWVRAPPAPPDPLTGREIRFRKSCKTERAAQGRARQVARVGPGRQPDSDVTVAQLLDQYVSTAGSDVSTREATSEIAVRGSQARTLITAALDTLG